jgi:hypothetical protein
MVEGRNVFRVLMGKPKGKKPLGRPRRRWEDGIKMDLREIGWAGVCGVDFTGSRYGSLEGVVNAVMNLRFLAQRS